MEAPGRTPAETLARETQTLPCTAFSHRDALANIRKADKASFDNPLAFVADVTKMAPKGSPRFGTLSHHSFFSRHNPHPNRVTHIQGLNGNPVCMVNDDWYVTTPLLPHPFIKNQLPRTMTGASSIQALYRQCNGISSTNHGTALFSESWREELKDLAAKVSMSAATAKRDSKTEEDRTACRKTQYSAQTGRIIPPSSGALGRRSSQASLRHPGSGGQTPPQALHHQELMVLELLCQILQTDSLSHVQQWLLLAGQREKDMVMDLIQKAVDSSMLNSLDQGVMPRSCQSLPVRAPSTGQHWRKHRLSRSQQVREAIKEEDKPERVGTAEVLQVHSDKTSHLDEKNIPGDCHDSSF